MPRNRSEKLTPKQPDMQGNLQALLAMLLLSSEAVQPAQAQAYRTAPHPPRSTSGSPTRTSRPVVVENVTPSAYFALTI